MKWFLDLFKWAPDNGGDGGAVTTQDLAAAISTTQASYLNDLEEADRKDDFTGIEDVKTLYKSYKELKGKNSDFETQLKDSLKIPGKDASIDDIKSFFTKIGMPDSKDGYNLSDFDYKPEDLKVMRDNFRDTAYKYGLTKTQAEKVWAHEVAMLKGVQLAGEKLLQQAKDSYKTRYDSILKTEYPDSAKRQERMNKESNLYKEFCSKFGVGQIFEKTGITHNPEVVHTICKAFESYAQSDIVGGKSNKVSETDFLKQLYPSMFK